MSLSNFVKRVRNIMRNDAGINGDEILPPAELLADYFKKRKALDHEIDKTLAEIQRILGIEVKIDNCKKGK